jgi:ubiquinone/menaquinone biosynthesis C-methylase UbiE
MSVAAHLRIRLEDYDRRVRTFIPSYEALLDATAGVCAAAVREKERPTIVDLGVGTGALASRCLAAVPSAIVVGVDSDADILGVAMRRFARLPNPVTLVRGDLAKVALPAADAIVATLALHHIATPARKRAFYRRCYRALGPGGIVASGDFHPSAVAALADQQMRGWIAHLRKSYTAARTRRLLEAWAGEDTYMTLEEELAIVQAAGFAVDVAWRRDGFAVIVGVRPQ